MSDAIVHTPYDLGLGVTLGIDCEVGVCDTCHVQILTNNLILIWEVLGAPKPFLAITFGEIQAVRVLDETWLSTETDPQRWEGIDGSFARTVKGGDYPTPTGLMNEIAGPVVHYQFVTECDCVDVIAGDKPIAQFIDQSQLADYTIVPDARLS